MSREPLALQPLEHVAVVNPATLSQATDPSTTFDYVDLSVVSRGKIDWGEVASYRFFTAPSRARRLVMNGDVLYGTVRPGNQSHGFVSEREELTVASTGFAVIRAVPNKAEPRFLFHAVLGNGVSAQARTREVGSNYPAITERDVRAFLVAVLPLPEQRGIAEILDTLDEAIRKTEQVIAKLQQMKQGLLHDLLTRGIDENGELRDPLRHPEQFKDSPLGRIPKEWEVATISALLSDVDPAMRSGPFGSALLKHELVSSGVPLLGIDNVHVEEFVAEYRRFVTAAKARTLARYLVRPRDVMITIMGTVGRCAVVPEDICQALSTKHVWTITFDQTRYSPYLACLQLNYAPWVLRHLSSDEQGGIMSAIRSETLRTTRLPVPNRDEQRAVERVLDENDRKISAEREALSKLRLLKQGLMDDLLTGRVRVKVTEPAE